MGKRGPGNTKSERIRNARILVLHLLQSGQGMAERWIRAELVMDRNVVHTAVQELVKAGKIVRRPSAGRNSKLYLNSCHVGECSYPADPDFFIHVDGKDRPLCKYHAASLLRWVYQPRLVDKTARLGFADWQCTFDIDESESPYVIRSTSVRDWLRKQADGEEEED